MSRRIHAYESGGDKPGDESDDEPRQQTRARRRVAPLVVLRDDPRFVVVDKPAGLVVIPGRTARDAPTVVSELWRMWRARDPDAPSPVVCHRLDRDTSGCLVLARDRDTARELMHQFRQREVRKAYLALVVGAPQPPRGELSFRLAPDRRRPGSMMLVRKGGRRCEGTYETLETFRGLSLVRVRPRTGRTHEVRLGLASLGTPCAVDPLYGSSDGIYLSRFKRGYKSGRGREERPLVARLTLHAAEIAFRSPGAADGDPTGDVLVEAPLARDLQATLRQLRRHAAPGTL